MSYVRASFVLLATLLWIGMTCVGSVRAQVQDSLRVLVDENVEEMLSDDRLAQFRAQRLALQLVGRQVSSYEAFRESEGVGWHRWKVFRGDHRVSEEDFLSDAGYYRYAQEASAFHRDARHNLIAGVFLFIAGGVATYIGYNMEDFIDSQHGSSKGMMGAGITVSGLGLGLSVSNMLKSRRQWAPFSRAYDITREYNQELLHELQKQE